jgi:hypothetical protein
MRYGRKNKSWPDVTGFRADLEVRSGTEKIYVAVNALPFQIVRGTTRRDPMFSKSAFAVFLLFPAFATDNAAPDPGLTVHEWGTFSSVAGENGAPVSWASLAAPSDLPCFVYRLGARCVKCNATSTVRMETPVLYFYASRPTTVSVHVDLPSGMITEWYPKASGVPKDITYGADGKIDWGPIEVMPGAAPEFPTDGSDSHYYPARNTDSAALRDGEQQEKLLFYRGVAEQGVFLEAQIVSDDRLRLRNRGSASIPFAVVFENRAGRSGYRIVRDLRAPVSVELPELTADVAALHRDLASALTEAGLYPKEAAAMIDTWRDSWFEEGMRVFYILPRAAVDSVLPLKIAPSPASTVRVFVGRVEVLSGAMRQTIEKALVSGDTRTLTRCGRYLEPFVTQIRHRTGVAVSPTAQAFLDRTRAQNAQYKVAPCTQPPLPLATDQQ